LIEINISNQVGNNRNPSITAIRQSPQSVKQPKRGKMKSKVTGKENLDKQSDSKQTVFTKMNILSRAELAITRAAIEASRRIQRNRIVKKLSEERGDVPGWVLVVLMTTGLVTAIWTIAAPRLTTILKNSLDAMNGIR
jgi:hypothetical protein